jgi:hypothetical protein
VSQGKGKGEVFNIGDMTCRPKSKSWKPVKHQAFSGPKGLSKHIEVIKLAEMIMQSEIEILETRETPSILWA